MIHPSAEVSPDAVIGQNTLIWNDVQVREGARVGDECIIGKNVYVDTNLVIGNRCKIQNNCMLYHGSELEDGVFLGPGVILTNDEVPRAINLDGSPKTQADWHCGKVLIQYGASLGTRVIVMPNVTIGPYAMVVAGSMVHKDVPAHALVAGMPARHAGFVCRCGTRLAKSTKTDGMLTGFCSTCEADVEYDLR